MSPHRLWSAGIGIVFVLSGCGGDNTVIGKEEAEDLPAGTSEYAYHDGLRLSVATTHQFDDEDCAVRVDLTADLSPQSDRNVELTPIHVVLRDSEGAFNDKLSGNEDSIVGGSLTPAGPPLTGRYCFEEAARGANVEVQFRTSERRNLNFLADSTS